MTSSQGAYSGLQLKSFEFRTLDGLKLGRQRSDEWVFHSPETWSPENYPEPPSRILAKNENMDQTCAVSSRRTSHMNFDSEIPLAGRLFC